MKKLFIGLAAVPFLAGVAMAGQPTPLSDSAMDQVTAGAENAPIEIKAESIVSLSADEILDVHTALISISIPGEDISIPATTICIANCATP
jgi:hypothetical protein